MRARGDEALSKGVVLGQLSDLEILDMRCASEPGKQRLMVFRADGKGAGGRSLEGSGRHGAAAKRSQRRRSLVSSTSHTAGTRSATSHVLPARSIDSQFDRSDRPRRGLGEDGIVRVVAQQRGCRSVPDSAQRVEEVSVALRLIA